MACVARLVLTCLCADRLLMRGALKTMYYGTDPTFYEAAIHVGCKACTDPWPQPSQKTFLGSSHSTGYQTMLALPPPKGRLIVALTSLGGAGSHLAKEFDLQGRVGNHDPAAQLGNPMHNIQIRDMINGYHKQTAELGYQKRGAMPLEETELRQLLESMCSDLTATPL